MMLDAVTTWLDGVLAYWLRVEASHLVWDAGTPWPVFRAAWLVTREPRR